LKTNNKLVFSIAGALLLVALIALIVAASFWAFKQSETALEARRHTSDLILRANALMSELKDAETGQRGYLLTGDEAFLEPYLMVRDHIIGDLDQLRQLNSIPAANKPLNALVPLVDAKMAELAEVIELRRKHDMAAVLTLLSHSGGQQLMTSIRAQMSAFNDIKHTELAKHEATLLQKMRNLFVIIVFASLLTLLFALSLPYFIYRESQQRIKNLLHIETEHLLELQEQTNKKLQQTNVNLEISEEKLAVTLNSIGDAVIATDAEARVTVLNAVAAKLTGWTQAEATGRPVAEIFHIINKHNREPITIPVMATLANSTVQGLADHTLLIARNGSEFDIADSCAPIRDRDGQVLGTVLVFRDITEERAAQLALRESDARSNFILEMTHTGGWDLDLITHATHRTMTCDRIFGYDSFQQEWTYETFLEHILPEDRAEVERLFLVANTEKTDWNFECRIRRADGKVRWIWATGEHQRDMTGISHRMAGIVQDITERKQIQAALQETERRFRNMIDALPIAIYTTDAEGLLTYFNPAAVEFSGRTPQIGTDKWCVSWKVFLMDGTPVPFDQSPMAMSVQENRSVTGIEAIAERPDGSRVIFRPYPTPLSDAHGNVIGGINMLLDITETKLAEAKLHEAITTAEQANKAKSDFLSRMSHELRTPLNAILGFSQLLEAGNPQPTASQHERIAQIIKAGWYLLDLINEILDLALIESGNLSLSQEPVSLIDLLLECQAMIEPKLQTRGIKLAFLPFDNTSFIYADRTRVKQALINLLSNAIKYNCEHGTIDIKLTLTSPERIRISIIDSGVGLPADKLAQIFQPFNRLGQENGSVEGTGIGLVVTKQLVEMMGGAIGVESTVGVGSEFWIELLRDDTLPHTDDLPILAKLNTHEHSQTTPSTLLYVEDNPANLMLVEHLIEGHPHLSLISARDGNLGISMARKHLPNVILMDINLPGINGMKALKILREDLQTQHIPIIALSANAMPHDIEKGLAAGFFRYLTKPIKVKELLIALDEALKHSNLELVDANETGQIQ